ncbi:hypothetical protein GMSM_36860 [Geomonas sp. Red276]
MFCIVAFIILAIFGIFSAGSRELAREAWGCVFRRVTFRPCTTGFDEKIKSRILGSVINRSETAARLLNRNFEPIAWVMFLIVTASSVYAVRGLYLFYVTGSCSGLNETSFCLLDPSGENSKVSAVDAGCREKPTTVEDLTLKEVDLRSFPTIKGKGKGRIVVIGCYGCAYTRRVYDSLKELANRNGASFTFIDYPVKVKTNLMTRLGYCVYQHDPDRYWKLNETLFTAQLPTLDTLEGARAITEKLGLDWGEISRCLDSPATRDGVDSQAEEALKTNFFGTPTVFVNGKAFVGPKPSRVYAIALNGLVYWMK